MFKCLSLEGNEVLESNVNETISDLIPSEDALVLILDLSPGRWYLGVAPKPEEPEKRIYLHNFFTVLANFLKFYGYMSVRNKSLIIVANNHSSYHFTHILLFTPIYSYLLNSLLFSFKILYEGIVYNDWTDSCFGGDNSNSVDTNLKLMWNKIIDFINEGLSYPDSDTQLTSAISMGFLCINYSVYINFSFINLNRIKCTNEGFGRKIIIFDISNSENYKSQYIGLMNIAYSALSQNITINTFALGQPSRILEQLSAITNAKYLLVSKLLNFDLNFNHINQYLTQLITVLILFIILFWYLPSEGMSEMLSTNLSFDFGNVGICYCHYKSVDVTYLCPCCFAGNFYSLIRFIVYCSEIDDKGKYRIICMVCGSRLTRKLIKQKLSSEADFSKI
ncbi:uncharacterized protein TA11370 [Theileria annulata]|uniref:Uncharacterized protein n=1 Tax=Theileria annulata TaxID=5874 RepID=Q4U8M4_THEAN|nr:uncharacterized protein TA11370 [Theileria annulata]CAI76829.1 hypothetical protein, conserved [Theileria annulata]|eukprot:XP_953454.1 hypothetical protein, conserved [Theileria annulata]